MTGREHMDQASRNGNGDQRRNDGNDDHVTLHARLAMATHMSALHRRVNRLVARCARLIAHVVGAHHLSYTRIDFRNVDHVRLVGANRVQQSRFIRVGLLQRGISRRGITKLVGRSREHLLVHLRRDGRDNRTNRCADQRSRNADNGRKKENRCRRQRTGNHLCQGKILKKRCQLALFGTAILLY